MSAYLEECVKCNPIGNKVTESEASAMQEHAILFGYAIFPTQTYCRKHFQEMYPKQVIPAVST